SPFSFFFFQAEDGIRDLIVTGVQTCALPIFRVGRPAPRRAARLPPAARHRRRPAAVAPPRGGARGGVERRGAARGARLRRARDRSEERRVGKECRGRWWRYQ